MFSAVRLIGEFPLDFFLDDKQHSRSKQLVINCEGKTFLIVYIQLPYQVCLRLLNNKNQTYRM